MLQKFWIKINFQPELYAKMLRFLPKYEDFWLLFSKVNIKKSSTHGWAQQWLCFTLNWMDYPKYHRFFWLISWLFHKSSPKTKLSTTGTLSTIGKLPYAFQKRSLKIMTISRKNLIISKFLLSNKYNKWIGMHTCTYSFRWSFQKLKFKCFANVYLLMIYCMKYFFLKKDFTLL